MSEHPARILEKLDPEFIKLVENMSEFILIDIQARKHQCVSSVGSIYGAAQVLK